MHVGLRLGVFLFDHNVGRFQRQLAALGHGVAGVDDQIEQGTFQLIRIDKRQMQVVGQHRIDLDGGAQRAPHQIQHPKHQLVEIRRLRQQGLMARERQ